MELPYFQPASVEKLNGQFEVFALVCIADVQGFRCTVILKMEIIERRWETKDRKMPFVKKVTKVNQ